MKSTIFCDGLQHTPIYTQEKCLFCVLNKAVLTTQYWSNLSFFLAAMFQHLPCLRSLQRIAWSVVLLITCFCLGVLPAQTIRPQETAVQTHSWWHYFGTHRLTNQWSVHTEVQIRRADVVASWQQLLLRTGINYHLTDNITLTAGYCYVGTHPYGEQPIRSFRPEHRPWEQVLVRHFEGIVEFQHRFRLEQRFLGDFEATSAQSADGADYQNRMRYRCLVTVPFSGDRVRAGTWFANVYDEIFINFGESVRYNVFDQNRLGANIGFQFLPNANIQIGYMNQTIQKPNGFQLESNNTLMFFLFYNLDFRQ